MSSFDPSHLCSPGWTVQSRNASWFRMKLGGWLYCSQNQNIRVLSMFFSHPTKERGRKSNRGCTPQIGGAYFLKVKVLVAQSCLTLFDPMDCSLPGSSLQGILPPWDLPSKSTGVGCHFLLQGIFLTQGLNLDLPHSRQMLNLWATREVWNYLCPRITLSLVKKIPNNLETNQQK